MNPSDQQPDISAAARARTSHGFRVSLALIVCGSIAFAVMMSMIVPAAHNQTGMRWYDIVLLGVAAFTILLGVVLVIIYSVRRRKQIAAALAYEFARLDFAFVNVPSKLAREALFRHFAHLPFLRHGAKGITHAASGVLEDTPVELILHTYMVSTGKSTHAVQHTVASCECPAGWPTLTMTPEHALHKIGGMLGFKDIRVESESFNRAWHVKSDDENFAVTLLSPSVQSWMGSNSKQESWHIGHGRICRVRQRTVEPEQLELFMRGPIELLSVIAPEMSAWESKPTTA